MIKLIALFILEITGAWCSDQVIEAGVPTFAVAFHLNESVDARVDALNKQSATGRLPFAGKISGTIQSDGVRIGGEHLALKGTYYDSESQSILHVGGGVEIHGPEFSFAGFPPGDYLLSLDVQSSSIYARRVRLPLPDNEANGYKINISKATEVSGKVENIPIWALESPLVGIVPALSVIDKTGRFKFFTYSSPPDNLVVKFRFLNPFQKNWDQAMYRFDFIDQYSASPQTINLPEIGNWKVAEAKIKFSDDLPAGLKPVLQNISVTATSSDGRIVYRCNPDIQGRFILIGLPDGEFTLGVDDVGNPPFVSDPVVITVKDHTALKSPLELVLNRFFESKK